MHKDRFRRHNYSNIKGTAPVLLLSAAHPLRSCSRATVRTLSNLRNSGHRTPFRMTTSCIRRLPRIPIRNRCRLPCLLHQRLALRLVALRLVVVEEVRYSRLIGPDTFEPVTPSSPERARRVEPLEESRRCRAEGAVEQDQQLEWALDRLSDLVRP